MTLRLNISALVTAALCAGGLVALNACTDDGQSSSSMQAPTVNSTSVYDPSLPSKPGDTRPTVPSTDEVPQADPGNGNMGILIPTQGAPAAMGGKR